MEQMNTTAYYFTCLVIGVTQVGLSQCRSSFSVTQTTSPSSSITPPTVKTTSSSPRKPTTESIADTTGTSYTFYTTPFSNPPKENSDDDEIFTGTVMTTDSLTSSKLKCKKGTCVGSDYSCINATVKKFCRGYFCYQTVYSHANDSSLLHDVGCDDECVDNMNQWEDQSGTLLVKRCCDASFCNGQSYYFSDVNIFANRYIANDAMLMTSSSHYVLSFSVIYFFSFAFIY